MDSRKKKIIVGAAIILAILLIGAGTAAILGGSGARERSNMLALARDYIDRGDFDRALDILDQLLIRDKDDAEAQALLKEALDRKAGLKPPEGDDAAAQALAQSLDQLGKSLERSASELASQAGGSSGSSSQSASAQDSAAAAEAARLQAEADAAAARKRAQDEAFAKANAELKALMEKVNGLVEEGSTASGSGQYAQAKSKYDEAAGLLPADEPKFASSTWSDIAEGYYDGYKHSPESSGGIDSIKQAQRAAQEAIRLAPTDPATARPHYTLSKIYNDSNLPDQAVSELEQAVKLDPNDYLYAYQLGRAYFMVKKYEEARRMFESVTGKLNPRFEPAWYDLGITYLALKNQNSALASFRKAAEIKPDYVNAHIRIGRILKDKNDYAGAVKSFNTALSFEADNVSAHRYLGETYASWGKLADAETSFKRALAIERDAVTSYNLAKVQYDQAKYADALPNASKATELAPSTSLYHYQLGLCAEKLGDVDRAITAYAKAAELDSKSVDARVNLGKIYLDSGFTDKALTLLDAAYKINPKSLEANNNLGKAYGEKGMYDKSVFHYELALAQAPRDTTIMRNLASAYVQKGELAKARDTYQSLVKLDPKAWDAMHELGKVYVALGDTAAAKKILTDLLAQKPDYEKRPEVETILVGL